MEGRKLAAVAVAIACLGGCASYQERTAPWPWEKDANLCPSGVCLESDSLKVYMQASDYCRRVQNYYEAGGLYARSGKLALGTMGAVAGSVLAPLAEGSAAAAWAGVSGVSNGLQTQMDQAFSNAVDIQRRAAVVAAASRGKTDYDNGGDDHRKRVDAAVNMARTCGMSSAESDQATMRALMGPAAKPGLGESQGTEGTETQQQADPTPEGPPAG